jgi:hypothetical protein
LQVTVCSSWSEFKDRLMRFASLPKAMRDAYIFRGRRDSDWGLESTFDRVFSHLEVLERGAKLERLLNGFAQELYGIEASHIVENSERLELLGRHHGLPTTVLDWTRSPYVAAYFAFEVEQAPTSGTVAIWSFDRRRLSQSTAAPDVLIDDMSLVGDNVRAIHQRGVFLRLPIGIKGEKALSAGLRKFTIPHSERTVALNDLDAMTITAKALFQDRDAAARTALIRETLR